MIKILTPKELTGFYGTEMLSENKQFTAYFAQGHYDEGRWINGDVALIERNNVLFSSKFTRPLQVRVSNQGIIAIYDDTYHETDRLGGTVFIYNILELLLQIPISANLYKLYFSMNSEYLIFNTFHSKTDDANKIFIIDIYNRILIEKIDFDFWFEDAMINPIEKTISLISKDGLTYEINFQNVQINLAEYEKQIFSKGSVIDKLRFLEDKYKDKNLLYKQNIYFETLNAAISNNSDTEIKSILLRQLGEYYFKNDNYRKAIEIWEQALTLNPRVGIKKS